MIKKYDVLDNGELLLENLTIAEIIKLTDKKRGNLKVTHTGYKLDELVINESNNEMSVTDLISQWDKIMSNLKSKTKCTSTQCKDAKNIVTASARSYR